MSALIRYWSLVSALLSNQPYRLLGRTHNVTVSVSELELELELIQTQMAQKPMLRAEVYARALRASQ